VKALDQGRTRLKEQPEEKMDTKTHQVYRKTIALKWKNEN